jgi:death-on-curing protein
MITVEVVLGIHRVLIKKYGGHPGVRDQTLLKSAIARPYHTFDGKDLYHTSLEKAAAIIESILINHPFMDGNKRTGYVLMREFYCLMMKRILRQMKMTSMILLSVSQLVSFLMMEY